MISCVGEAVVAGRRRAGIGRVIAYYDLCDGMGCFVFFSFSLCRSRSLSFLSFWFGHVGEWRWVSGGVCVGEPCLPGCVRFGIVSGGIPSSYGRKHRTEDKNGE